MDVTRNNAQRSASSAQAGKRVISDTAAQVWAALITVATFSGIATALHFLFERMGGA